MIALVSVVLALGGGADLVDVVGSSRRVWAVAQEAAAPAPPAPPVAPVPPPAQPAAPAAPAPPRPARGASAQAPPADPVPPAGQPGGPPPVPDVVAEPSNADDQEAGGDEVVRILSDYTLMPGERIDEAVVVMGSARIDGHVAGDLVVVLGEARLGPTAVVEGDVVVVGGSLLVGAGATASRDVVVVGGALEAPSGFMPGGEQVVFGFKALGDSVRGFLPWVLRGLMLGRPIVPDLPWVWAVVGVLFLVYLGVLLVFEHPVRATANALAATPLRALVTGLAVMILTLPVIIILAATVVGLLVVPVVLCALFVAGIVGRIAAARWLGARVLPEGEESDRLQFLRSFAIGCVLLILAYMVPILGGTVWALMGSAGLGAAALAFMAAYRKENPPLPMPVPPDVPPGFPPTVPPMPFGGAAASATGAASESLASAAFPGEGDMPGLGPAAATGFAPGIASGTVPGAVQPLALFPRASFWDRAAALVLDGILVALVIGIVPGLRGDDAFPPLFLGYRFVMWVWKGVSVGGIICQLRVIKVDGSRMSGGEALVRTLGSLFSLAVFGIGCLWVLRDPDRQSWHDKMAGTVVVKVPRNWPV